MKSKAFKSLLYVILLLVSVSCFGQPFTILKGKVTDCNHKATLIEGVELILINNKGKTFTSKTNKTGEYTFFKDTTGKCIFEPNTKYQVCTRVSNSVKTTASPTGYVNSSDKEKFTIDTLKS